MRIEDIEKLVIEYVVDCINLVMLYRNCYPVESFEHRQSFHLKVPFNRHPLVNKYIEEFVNSIKLKDLDKIWICTETVKLELDLKRFVPLRFRENTDLVNVEYDKLYDGIKLMVVEMMSKIPKSERREELRLFVESDLQTDEDKFIRNDVEVHGHKIVALRDLDVDYIQISNTLYTDI